MPIDANSCPGLMNAAGTFRHSLFSIKHSSVRKIGGCWKFLLQLDDPFGDELVLFAIATFIYLLMSYFVLCHAFFYVLCLDAWALSINHVLVC